MSYRIDIETSRRYEVDGILSTALTQAERQRFEQAIEDALDARSNAGGSSQFNETEERVFIVEDGDSLVRIAEELNVSLEELLELNQRSDIPDPDQIDPNDVLFVPHTSPEEAATTARDENGVPLGEEGFTQSLRERGNQLEYADDPSAIDVDAEVGQIASDIDAYLAALPANERQAALQRLYDHDWVDAGPAQMAIEQAAENNDIELLDTSHNGPDIESEARDIIADANAANDPDEALRILEAAYDEASPAVQAALDRSSGAQEIAAAAGADIVADAQAEDDPAEALRIYQEGYADAPERVQSALDESDDVQALIDDATHWAAEPLDEKAEGVQTPQLHMLETMQRLDQLTEGVDPALAAEVMDGMIAMFEAANDEHLADYGGLIMGPNGTQLLLSILERIDGTTAGDSATEQLAGVLIVDMDSVRNAMNDSVSEGGRIPALALAIASQEGVEGFREEVFLAVEQFRDHNIAGHADAYTEHLDELSFLIVNASPSMTQEQLDTAIEDYFDSNPDWQEEFEALQGQLADDGSGLLTQIQQLQALPEEVRADYQERLDGLLDDPNSQLAVSTALQQRPELVRGEAGNELIQTFNELGITGSENPLAVNLAGAYLRENVIAPSASIDPSDPASLQDAHAQLEEALEDNPQLAQLLGITTDELNELGEAFHELIPQQTDEFDAQRYGIDVARNLNNALDKIDGIFRDTPFNRGFRTSALAIVGSGLANAIQAYGEDPSLRNALQVSIESARVGVDGAQLVDALLNPSDGSRVTNGLKLGGKFVHILGAGLAGVDALTRMGQGDFVGAGLNVAVAGGVGYSVWGSSSLAGPIGFGIATVATLGLFAWDGIQNVQHNNRFQTQTTVDFLSHAGFNEEAAQALSDQSGKGYSPVPILMDYGVSQGLSPEQTVEWINSIADGEEGPAKLAALRDNLHQTLDEIDGDLSRFEATADNDDQRIWDLEERPWFARAGEARPESAAQLEPILAALDIDIPTAHA